MALVIGGGEFRMFNRRGGDLNSRRFWNWFAAEARGLANAMEALSRGESDAEWALIALNERIHRFDPALEADIVRDLDGACRMTVSGPDASVDLLIQAAPAMKGWQFSPPALAADGRRVPFRRAPRPSLDLLGAPVQRHEAYA